MVIDRKKMEVEVIAIHGQVIDNSLLLLLIGSSFVRLFTSI